MVMLQAADTTLATYRTAINDITALLASPSPDRAVRTAIWQVIAEQIPAARPDWHPGRLAPGSTWGEAARMIAACLEAYTTPATVLLGELAGTTLTLRPCEPVTRQFGDGDRYAAELLHAGAQDWVYERAGTLHAPGPLIVAQTRLVLLTDRLPAEAWAAIWEGQPCGAVLGPYGMRRSSRRASAGDDGVTSAAVLSLGGRPAGLAAEHVPASFCKHVADLANQQTSTEGEDQ